MKRPDFITQEDIVRWDDNLQNDMSLPTAIKLAQQLPLFKEVMYTGLWLAEELTKLKCNEILITRICYTTGRLSFGQDPWEVAQDMLTAYQKNELEFEIDYNDA